jgi:hypothetical protein
MEDTFNEQEVYALRVFNQCCVKIRGDYSLDAFGLMEIRDNTLKMVYSTYPSVVLDHLLKVLIKLKPLWEKDVLESSETTLGKLRYYFFRCAKSLVMTANGLYAKSSLSTYFGSSKIEKGYCMIHPNKETKVGEQLCFRCLKKKQKLGLEAYPLDFGLLYILSIRKKYGRVAEFCINHPKVVAMNNGLCVKCNEKIGKLEELLKNTSLNEKTYYNKFQMFEVY